MRFVISEYIFKLIQPYLFDGAICIDATMGNGNDTLFISNMIKRNGSVMAFDIQQTALDNTQSLLQAKAQFQNYTLKRESHTMINHYFTNESVDFIIFNLGYLPKGDKSITTMAASSLDAIIKGLALLKPQGVMHITIYPNERVINGECVCEEKQVILPFLQQLSPQKYAVIVQNIVNSKNNPPIPVTIFKIK